MSEPRQLPAQIWAFEDDDGGVPRAGYWIDEQSETPEGSPQFTRTDLSQASVAAALEAAAGWHDAEIVRLKAQIDENNKYLQSLGKSTNSRSNDLCENAIGRHKISAERIRALITPDQRTALQAAIDAAKAEVMAEDAAKPVLAHVCDGKEQEAFEAWAKRADYEMREHPLHYIFLDEKTDAARAGWREGIRYAREYALAQIGAKP